MRAWGTLFVPIVTFKPIKLESSNFIHVYAVLQLGFQKGRVLEQKGHNAKTKRAPCLENA